MKSILLIPIAFLMLLAAGFAGASATIDTSSLPDEFAAGSAYDIPVTVDDVNAFKFTAVYDAGSMSVVFSELEDGVTVGGRDGKQSIVWVSSGNDSTSFIVRVVPKKSSTLALSFGEASDSGKNQITLPGETVSFKVTSATPTSVSFSDDGTPDTAGFSDVSSGSAGTTTVSGSTKAPENTSGSNTVSGDSNKTPLNNSSSGSTSKPTEEKKTPAPGILAIVAGLAVAGVLRRKL